MAVIPNIIIQPRALGGAYTGVDPDIGGSAPDVDSQITKQLRGRVWRYDELDDGGIFRSPETAVRDLLRERNVPTKGIDYELQVPGERSGFTLRRIMFSGAGTTRVQGLLVDPYATLTAVAAEALTPAPVFDGSHLLFSTSLVNGELAQDTLVITAGDESIRDTGGGFLVGSAGARGWVDYPTGTMRILFKTAPAAGAAFTADYKYGSASASYEFLDTTKIGASIDPESFAITAPSSRDDLMVPPLWYIQFITTGALTSAGSLGVMISEGMSYIAGQQELAFGVVE
jgi:hypothetical protein